MVTLTTIDSSLFGKLYDCFLHDDDPFSDEQDWRNVFDYQWHTDEGHCGYAMLDGDEVVGMMGMVFSQRWINQSWKKFCNIHTWWVRKDHRGRSMAMLKPLLGLKDYTVTHFTPCDTIRGITKRLGFQPLSTQLKVLLPLPPDRKPSGESAVTFDKQIMLDVLAEPDKKLMLDHEPYGCGNLLIRDGSDYCYVLYTRVVRHWFPYCHIHYVSDKQLFERHQSAIRRALLKENRARYLALDARLCDGLRVPLSFRSFKPPHGMYRSPDLDPSQIDNLYSDVVMLNLSVHPDVTYEVKTRLRRIRSGRK